MITADKVTYILADGMNGDKFYRGNNLNSVKKAAREYDEGCEGDWLPVLYKYDPEVDKYRRVDFVF